MKVFSLQQLFLVSPAPSQHHFGSQCWSRFQSRYQFRWIKTSSTQVPIPQTQHLTRVFELLAKKIIWLSAVGVFLVIISGAFAQTGATNRPTLPHSSTTLAAIDALVTYTSDFSGEYTITQERPGQGTSVTKAAMFRRDREDKFVILITEPAVDRGKGYLKIGNNLWLYDPVARRFTVTSARDRFQNSNARNTDFTRSNLANDFRIVGETQERLGAFNTRVFDLEAINDTVTFPRLRIWVDENNLIRKQEDYSLSGQLMRTIAIPTYQRLGQHFIPVNVVIVDALAGRTINGQFRNERTIITVERPTFAAIPDMVFTQAYLERVSQ